MKDKAGAVAKIDEHTYAAVFKFSSNKRVLYVGKDFKQYFYWFKHCFLVVLTYSQYTKYLQIPPTKYRTSFTNSGLRQQRNSMKHSYVLPIICRFLFILVIFLVNMFFLVWCLRRKSFRRKSWFFLRPNLKIILKLKLFTCTIHVHQPTAVTKSKHFL